MIHALDRCHGLLACSVALTIALGARDERGITDPSVAGTDGPYLFITDDALLDKRVVGEGDRARKVERTLERDDATFELEIPGAGGPLMVRVRATESTPTCELPDASQVFAVSDIEGECEGLVELLIAGGVIDSNLNWTFGDGHLVFVGDFFDRGLQVTECLWLCYELEALAKAAGGGSHFLLGNHEVMNLCGDFRYVRRKYRLNAELLGRTLDELHSKSTVLGRWLRTRNAALRIGRELFVHGGVSREAAAAFTASSLAEMNDALRDALRSDEFPRTLTPRLSGVVDPNHGWIWFRGYLRDAGTGVEALKTALAAHDVDRIVIGHTLVDRVDFAHEGRVLAIDVHHASGRGEAALRLQGEWFRVTRDGRRESIGKAR